VASEEDGADMNLREELDRIACDAAAQGCLDWNAVPTAEESLARLRTIFQRKFRTALDEAVEACGKVLDGSSERFSQPEGAALLRAAIRKEAP